MESTSATVDLAPGATEPIELYWVAGCTACLRMKEFVERTGLPYQAINIAVEGTEKLKRLGIPVPAVCIGDRCVQGVDLGAVASLLGIEYQAPEILDPSVLIERYELIVTKLCALIRQIPEDQWWGSPSEVLKMRGRTLLGVAHHAASVMLLFLESYDPESYEGEHYELTVGDNVPDSVVKADDVIGHARETLRRLDLWWEDSGRDDDLTRVVSTYWGHHTVLEAFEREVWHTAQHTRQLAMYLGDIGVPVTQALTRDDLAGLPVPERIEA